jgi:nucleotide-binding universal stress UspA family protein
MTMSQYSIVAPQRPIGPATAVYRCLLFGAAFTAALLPAGCAVQVQNKQPAQELAQRWVDSGDAPLLPLLRERSLYAALLVMGCYGHSRAREWVLGGATRTVLGTMTLPVLLVH